MKMKDLNNRVDLTLDEQEIVGMPGDLLSEPTVPPRPRSATVLISVRLDRHLFDELNRSAQGAGRTFSETAREALRTFVGEQRADNSYPLREAHRARPVRKVSDNARLTWDDVDLRVELERYEAACRHAAMRDNAWRSYVDYARRFLAWRTGDYQPRGVSAGDRPVPRTAVSAADLRPQAADYAHQVQAAGRRQPTVDTYFRHAMFFIRWLEGDFQPGARLRGLR